jgi:hypothetical protein
MAKCTCGLAFAIIFAVVGLLVLIAGAVVPFVVRMIMDDKVKSALIINHEKQSDETVAKFIDNDLNYKFYMWNITNLPQAMSGSEKVRVEEVGPYEYVKYQHKYNITFAADGSTVTYFTWDYYHAQNSGTLNPLTDKITTINPVYPNAIAATASPLSHILPNIGLYYEGDDNHEERLYLQLTSGAFAKGLAAPFLNETGPLLSNLKVLLATALLEMWNKTMYTLAAIPPVGAVFNSSQVIAEYWANPRNTTFLCEDLAPYGFVYSLATGRCEITAYAASFPNCLPLDIELSGVPAMAPADIALVYSKSLPFGLFSAGGLFQWSTYVQQYAFGFGTVHGDLAGFVNAPAMLDNISPWFIQFPSTTNPTATNYRLCVSQIMRPNGHPLLKESAEWSDFGVYQFQTGGLTLSAFGARSIQQLPFPFSTYLPFPLPAAPEAGAFINPYTSTYLNISYDDTLFILRNFSDTFTLARWYLLNGGSFPFQCETGPQFESKCAGMKAYTRFIASEFGMKAPLQLSGLISLNTGLFMTRTPHEILFGYNDPLLVIAGVNPPFFPGFFGPNMTSQDLDWQFNQHPAAPDVEYTGQTDFDKIGQYKMYEGVSTATTLKNFPALEASSRRCITAFQALNTTGLTRFGYEKNCNLWTSSEVIDGKYTPYQFTPFDEGSGTEFFNLWVKEVRRSVRLIKQDGTIKFKGISLRRYTVDPIQLLKSSQNPANAKYVMTVDNGIVPMTRYFGGVDLFVSQPHFLGGNLTAIKSRLHATSTVNPVDDFTVHKTYLDIEPYTGKTMAARKRLQLGMFLSSGFKGRFTHDGAYAGVVGTFQNHLAPLYIPILWAEEGKDIGDEDASDFVSKIYNTRSMLDKVMIGGIAGGGAFGVIMVFVACRVGRRPGAQSKSSGRLSEDYMGGTTL